MIFISTGTLPLPFSRLVDTVVDYYSSKKSQSIIIQSGTYQPIKLPNHIILKPFFSFKQTIQYYKTADLTISAAGEASVFLILKHTKNIPIFFPRLKKYKEHVDNKQLATCQYLKKLKLAKVAIETNHLVSLLNDNNNHSSEYKYYNQSPQTSHNLKKLIKNLHSITD